MAEETSVPEESQSSETHITFNIKSSSDTKHVVTVPETMTVLELKQKLSTSEFADIAPERQRLIYSGRVLKDPDVLSTYKIKDGNTVHMVKSAASNQQQSQQSQQTSASPTPGGASARSNPASAGVPSNIAAGTGNDPLAGLTGARYAGFAQMPSASQFGADGGLNPAANPDEFLRMLENPMFQSEMNEAMNNPNVIRMMENAPQFRDNPMLRQMLQNPEFRRMMTDPQFIRQSIQMSRMFGGMGGMGGMGGGGGEAGMPAPGVTDNTPQQGTGTTPAQPGENTSDQTGQGQTQPEANATAGQGAANPFAAFGGMGSGNPFAALFGGGGGGGADAGLFNNPNPTGSPASGNSTANPQDQNNNAAQNPMGNLMNMMNLEAMMRGANAAEGQQGTGAGNPSPAALSPWLQQMTEQMMQQPQAPQDSRPPEEQYESQLRQLNDMGFFEFERNVRALRRSGGNVQGAVEYLLSDI